MSIFQRKKPVFDNRYQERNLRRYAYLIEETLKAFNLVVRVVEINLEPEYIQFVLDVPPGISVDEIVNKEKTLATALESPTGKITIQAPIPKRSLVGINLPRVTPIIQKVNEATGRVSSDKTQNNGLNNLMSGIGVSIISFLSPLIMILNYFSGIVGGIWILLAGGWRLIVLSFIVGFLSQYVFSLLLLPSLGLGALAIKQVEKKKFFLPIVIISITTLYDKFILMYWVSYILGIVLQLVGAFKLIPLLLLGYATVMAPLSAMAGREDGFGTWFALFYAECAYLLSGLFLLLHVDRMTIAGIQWLLFLLFSFIQIVVVGKVLKAYTANEIENKDVSAFNN